ncbi:hypothetical protein ITJ38_09695 [Agreia pratensis]|uniref:hypothetical protein n=1 Tax=Agreia pratensis TaxID=150121 RepID=UPI00188C087B|nr:hypothetical protein [Agreia pratensis]MBF4634673.1 hypothetical protein [Agreia pratensis]
MDPSEIVDLAEDAVQAWSEILAAKGGRTHSELSDLVRQTVSGHGILPTQVRERLTRDSVTTV